VVVFGIADYTNFGMPRYWLYLTDQHQWFVITLKLLKTWCIIRDAVTTFYTFYRGTKYIGVFHIVLVGMDNATRGCDSKSPSFVFVQQRAKHKGVFKRR